MSYRTNFERFKAQWRCGEHHELCCIIQVQPKLDFLRDTLGAQYFAEAMEFIELNCIPCEITPIDPGPIDVTPAVIVIEPVDNRPPTPNPVVVRSCSVSVTEPPAVIGPNGLRANDIRGGL